MDEFFKLSNMDKAWTIFFLCFLVVFVSFVAWAFIRLLRPKKIAVGEASAEWGDDGGGKKDDDERPSLRHHRYFKLMEAASNPAFFYSGQAMTAKEAINVAFLHDCKFKVFRDGIREFVVDLERHEGDGLGRLPEVVNDLVTEYERLSRRLVIDLPGGAQICGVPSCYMRKFNAWHAPHTRLCLDGINAVISDRIYPDWWTRTAAALEYLYMAFDMTREDAARTLSQLNGDLDREIDEMLCRDREEA